MSIAEAWAEAIYFLPKEVENPYTMSMTLLNMLGDLRVNYGGPIQITSSYRPLNAEKRTSAHQPNVRGQWEAVDLRCGTSWQRYLLVRSAYAVGFRRIGIYNLHIHVDVAIDLAQDVTWIGVSK